MVDKNRVTGAGDKAKGSVKEAAGKVTGDSKLKAEGKADKAGARSRTRSAASPTRSRARSSQPNAALAAAGIDGLGQFSFG